MSDKEINILNESEWKGVKEVLLQNSNEYNLPQLTGHKAKVLDAVMENTRKMLLKENASSAATAAGSIAYMPKMILPVLRRVMPTVIANEIIGVQPMTGPLGQIMTLRVKYAETAGSPVPVIAGSEALGPFDVRPEYSGNLNSANPKAAPTAQLESVSGKKINIELVKQTVEARSRKLNAVWSYEAAQDADSQYGIDLQQEILNALAQEITVEIDQEILGSLRNLAGTPTLVYDQNSLSGVPVTVVDEHAVLATLMNKAANVIAARTRRGAGNWAVVSPDALTILQSARSSAFARTTEGNFDSPTNVKFVGTLNNSMKIYSDTYASSSEVVLVGYKGSEVDAAAFYCPYIPLMSSGTVIDPVTFNPTVQLHTRFGYVELANTASSFGNAADYLQAIQMTNLRFT